MPKELSDKKSKRSVQDLHAAASESISPTSRTKCTDDLLISARIRTLRREQGVSIRALAEKCGISGNTLSLIENNRTSPSVHTLQLLADGLGVSLGNFFNTDHSERSPVYQRQGQRPLVYFANGTLEKLGEGLPPLGAEPILVTLQSHSDHYENIQHTGREFIYCLEGRVTCMVAGQAYQLSPGDSLLFDARSLHRWLNTYAGPSRLLVLFCPMDAHEQPAERHLDQ